jgi:CBS domain-containing protein
MNTNTPATAEQGPPLQNLDDDPVLTTVMTSDVETLPADARIPTALHLMATTGVRHVPVVDRGWCRGVLVETDLVRSLASAGRTAAAVAVLTANDLERPATRLPPTARVSDAARLMSRSGSDAVLVTDGGRLLGIVTATDLVRLLARRIPRL